MGVKRRDLCSKMGGTKGHNYGDLLGRPSLGPEGADAHTCGHTQSMHTPWLGSLSHLFVV